MKFLAKWAMGLIMVASLPAVASDWAVIEANELGVTEVDRQSIAFVAPGIRSVWVRYNFPEPQILNEGFPTTYSIALTLQYMDCERKSMSVQQTVYYSDMLQQKKVSSQKFNTLDYSVIVPDTIGEATHRAACQTPLPKPRKK